MWTGRDQSMQVLASSNKKLNRATDVICHDGAMIINNTIRRTSTQVQTYIKCMNKSHSLSTSISVRAKYWNEERKK